MSTDDVTALVDHDHPPLKREQEKCTRCGEDLILTHQCNQRVMQRNRFPDEPVLTINGHVVPVELCEPIRALLAEVARLLGTSLD